MKTTVQPISPKGFTLIELLIVIAVLGVLAAVVLVAINPIEQLARTRDAGRKTTVGQLKNAVQAYYTSRASWPATGNNWITTLVTAAELKQAPAPIAYTLNTTNACEPATTNGQNDFCYATAIIAGNTEGIVYVGLESGSEIAKCPAGQTPYFIWNSAEGRAGVICNDDTVGNPVPRAAGGYTYL